MIEPLGFRKAGSGAPAVVAQNRYALEPTIYQN